MIKHKANSFTIVEHKLIKNNGSVNTAHNSCVSCSLDNFNHNLYLTVVVFGSHSIDTTRFKNSNQELKENIIWILTKGIQ